MKKPPHRPQNTRRVESMRRCFEAAFDSWIVRDSRAFIELYGGAEFPLVGHGLSPADELGVVIAASMGEDVDESDVERDIEVWHGLYTAHAELLSRKPRGDTMLAYRIAAAMFNNQLARDQARGERLDEKPTTPGALQRAMNRAKRTSV